MPVIPNCVSVCAWVKGERMKEVKKRILFICTHNSARSQIAEGLTNALYNNKYEASSAGTEPTQVNPYAIKVMAEIGIDISMSTSKHVDEFLGQTFDYVVTVCDHAKETCPFFPGAKQYFHQGFTDPAAAQGSESDKITAFRRTRDEIRDWLVANFSREV